jgi:hypothetical protein
MKTLITLTGNYAGELVVAIAAAIVRQIELAIMKRKRRKSI